LPDKKKVRKGCEPSKKKTSKTGVEQRLTFDLLPLHLEGAAPSLDRLLEALDGLSLLLEGQLLAHACDAEHHQLALELGELGVPVLQRHLRRLASNALPLQGRPGVGKGGLLLLEPPLSPLMGGTLLQELVLSGGKRRDVGVEGGLQVVGLLGPLLERAPAPQLGAAEPAPPGATSGAPGCRCGRRPPPPPSWPPACASSLGPSAPAAAPHPGR
jgi:hypothetical protein